MTVLNLAPHSVACEHSEYTNNLFVVSRVANFGYGKIFIYHTGSFKDVLNCLKEWHNRATTVDLAIAYLKECGFTQVSNHPRDL